MKIELKKIKILEPPVKIKAGFRTIGGDTPIEPSVKTVGLAALLANGNVSDIVGNATYEEE